MEHRSGFVNILGEPNVGKSTLLNALLGEKLSIITNKPQTTRHRIIAIANEDHYQLVFSDTPGIILEPHYKMQEAMNTFAFSALEDADIILYLIDITQPPVVPDEIKRRISHLDIPKLLVINKIDLSTPSEVKQLDAWWASELPDFKRYFISALNHHGTNELLEDIVKQLPEGPAYYPKDQFTDRSERFFVSEIIREKILQLYHEEIPYSCEVIVTSFKEDETREDKLIRIGAEIIVNRKTQKSIIIGKGGKSIKQLGIAARKDIEAFVDRKVYLELYVRVKEKWRDDDRSLKSYGYLN